MQKNQYFLLILILKTKQIKGGYDGFFSVIQLTMLRFKTSKSELKARTEETRSAETIKIVGDPEDVIPYAWRFPLTTNSMKKVSRVLKTLAQEEHSRMLALRGEDN